MRWHNHWHALVLLLCSLCFARALRLCSRATVELPDCGTHFEAPGWLWTTQGWLESSEHAYRIHGPPVGVDSLVICDAAVTGRNITGRMVMVSGFEECSYEQMLTNCLKNGCVGIVRAKAKCIGCFSSHKNDVMPEELVGAAVTQNFGALKFAAATLRADRDFILQVIVIIISGSSIIMLSLCLLLLL